MRYLLVVDEDNLRSMLGPRCGITALRFPWPPPEEVGWEDTVLVTDDREVVIAARFNSYANPEVPYMLHCHILDHEDLGMMGQFEVVDS